MTSPFKTIIPKIVFNEKWVHFSLKTRIQILCQLHKEKTDTIIIYFIVQFIVRHKCSYTLYNIHMFYVTTLYKKCKCNI